MTQDSIAALLKFSIVEEDTKYLKIPLESVLNGSVDITLHEELPQVVMLPTHIESFWTPEESKTDEPVITITEAIRYLYGTKDPYEDIVNYLQTIAKCWQYRDLEFQRSILKKAAGQSPTPRLNTISFKVYGKDSDTHLTELINKNMDYIKYCWKNENKD